MRLFNDFIPQADILNINFHYMWWFSLHGCLCTMRTAGVGKDRRRCIGCPETRVTDICELPQGAGNRTWVLWKNRLVLPTTEPSLRPELSVLDNTNSLHEIKWWRNRHPVVHPLLLPYFSSVNYTIISFLPVISLSAITDKGFSSSKRIL